MLDAMYRAGVTRRIPLCVTQLHYGSQQSAPNDQPSLAGNFTEDFDESMEEWTTGDEVGDDAVPSSLWSVMDQSGTGAGGGGGGGGVYPYNTATVMSPDLQDAAIDAPSICVTQEILNVLEASIQPRGWVLVLMVMMAVIFVVGIIGNILVCVAIARYKFVRSVTAVFIASLAISDINVLLICLPVTVIDDVYHTWYWGTTTCKTIKFFQQLFVFVTILTLAMLAAERYATICYYSYGRGARNYRKRRKCRDAVGIVIAVWVISALLALPEVFRVSAVPVFSDSPLLTSCQSEWPMMSDFFLQLFYFAFLFILPLGVIGFCYYKIVRALSGDGSRHGAANNDDGDGATLPLPGDQSCPSLMVPSTVVFPTRSRSSSAHRKADLAKLSQLQSDYSEPAAAMYIAQHQHSHQLLNSAATSRNASFSLAPFPGGGSGNSNPGNGDAPAGDNGKGSDIPSAQLRQRWRLTKMLITIVILFLVSYLPVYLYLLSQPFDAVTRWIASMTDDNSVTNGTTSNSSKSSSSSSSNWRLHWDTKTGVALAVHFLVYVNSTVNPVIYYFMSDKFRQAFRKLLFCGILKRWCERRKQALSKQPQQGAVTYCHHASNLMCTQNGCYLAPENQPIGGGGGVTFGGAINGATPTMQNGHHNRFNNGITSPNVIPIIVVGGNSNSSGGGGGAGVATPQTTAVANNCCPSNGAASHHSQQQNRLQFANDSVYNNHLPFYQHHQRRTSQKGGEDEIDDKQQQ